MTEPKKLGKYEIRGELGQGAMGIVYEGFDPMIGRRVALKTVRREQLDRAEVDAIDQDLAAGDLVGAVHERGDRGLARAVHTADEEDAAARMIECDNGIGE